MRAANALSSNGGESGSKRANLWNCIVVRHMTKQRRLYLLRSPFSLCRKEGWPSRYSKTVALAKPTVSRSKRKFDAAALLDRRTRATKARSCQKPAAVRELLE